MRWKTSSARVRGTDGGVVPYCDVSPMICTQMTISTAANMIQLSGIAIYTSEYKSYAIVDNA